MKPTYAIVQPNEDGEPFSFVRDEYIEDGRLNIDRLMEDRSITEWVDRDDVKSVYWGEHRAMLLKVEVLKPRPEKVVERWTV